MNGVILDKYYPTQLLVNSHTCTSQIRGCNMRSNWIDIVWWLFYFLRRFGPQLWSLRECCNLVIQELHLTVFALALALAPSRRSVSLAVAVCFQMKRHDWISHLFTSPLQMFIIINVNIIATNEPAHLLSGELGPNIGTTFWRHGGGSASGGRTSTSTSTSTWTQLSVLASRFLSAAQLIVERLPINQSANQPIKETNKETNKQSINYSTALRPKCLDLAWSQQFLAAPLCATTLFWFWHQSGSVLQIWCPSMWWTRVIETWNRYGCVLCAVFQISYLWGDCRIRISGSDGW